MHAIRFMDVNECRHVEKEVTLNEYYLQHSMFSSDTCKNPLDFFLLLLVALAVLQMKQA